jgi:hypothetical protein
MKELGIEDEYIMQSVPTVEPGQKIVRPTAWSLNPNQIDDYNEHAGEFSAGGNHPDIPTPASLSNLDMMNNNQSKKRSVNKS